MKQQHQEHINQIKESNRQALEMAQQSINQMEYQMTVMYNSVKAAGNKYCRTQQGEDTPTPNQTKENESKKASKPMHEKAQFFKQCKQVVCHFERDCFDLNEN